VNSSYLSKENLICKTSVVDENIYIREQKGRFQRIRRYLSFTLMAIFILIPFIEYHGSQAVYFNLEQQRVSLFSLTLFPQDLLLLCLVFIFSAFLLFYITKIYGRIWCGFSCPQTIWMLLFNWVERRIEGSHNHSKYLNAQKLNFNKLVKKLVKHCCWLIISLFTALVFISYFVPVKELYINFFTLESSSLVVSWVLFFMACTYINAGWIREKMCLHMCPYSRIQSAMFDKSTKLVSYDFKRGESRGKRKRTQEKAAALGDCVDCNLCVQVCPVGIDIRDGLQYECINCGLCVDACDMTMDKFNYEKGLISFTHEQAPKNRWKRHIVYGAIVSLSILSMLVWVLTWQSFEVNIIRDRQALYRVNHEGHIENTYVFKIRNKSSETKTFKIAVADLTHARIMGQAKVQVLPGDMKTSSVTVAVEQPLVDGRNDIRFNIVDIVDNKQVIKNTSFYSGDGGW
jgi:cytochrome c oxidase accessory protein FixG